MKLSLREQLERLAQRPAAPRVLSGSPVTVRLEVPRGHRVPFRITIVKLLAHKGGMGLKPAFDLLNERLLVECEVVETLPGVENLPELIEELAKADVTATVVDPAFAK